ncbi:unannotated protein [freshwater metagenome]|uniref:Unannotated protein n=1 Tax=freshwater metagenome TaxID=449393 RepID=A0A6J7C935_9ZZZZ
MQHTVHHEEGDLVVDRACVRRRLPLRHCGADDDIAQQQGHIARIRGRPVGATTDRLAVQHDLGLGRVDREREHIGGPGLAHVEFVQLGHLGLADEQQRQLGQPAHTLRPQYLGG